MNDSPISQKNCNNQFSQSCFKEKVSDSLFGVATERRQSYIDVDTDVDSDVPTGNDERIDFARGNFLSLSKTEEGPFRTKKNLAGTKTGN